MKEKVKEYLEGETIDFGEIQKKIVSVTKRKKVKEKPDGRKTRRGKQD